MSDVSAMRNNPFAQLPNAPWFAVTSNDILDGVLPLRQRSNRFGAEGGKDESPHLSWSGAPRATKSFAVTMYDPDAPTGSGFWHWAVADIPVTVTELATGAGDRDGLLLPKGAFHLPNDTRSPDYVGGSPSAGGSEHRYFFVVHALSVKKINVSVASTPAYLGMYMAHYILGRAALMAIAADNMSAAGMVGFVP